MRFAQRTIYSNGLDIATEPQQSVLVFRGDIEADAATLLEKFIDRYLVRVVCMAYSPNIDRLTVVLEEEPA